MQIKNLLNIDRRIIYLLVLLALSIPLLMNYTIKPAKMQAADKLFNIIESYEVRPDKIAWVSMDFGPSTKAENGSQAEVVIEHLMRRRIPVVVVSLIAESSALLNSTPEKIARRLMLENPTEKWVYGKDWINLGYLAGGFLSIQGIPKSEDLSAYFKKDSLGNNLADLPAFQHVKTIENIGMVVELTGSPGTLEAYLQFFQSEEYRPIMAHGCTSIMTPQAYIFLDSDQLQGLFEGIGGAAWYSELLKEKHPKRAVDASLIINTGLGVAHLVIILLVLLGNFVELLVRRFG